MVIRKTRLLLALLGAVMLAGCGTPEGNAAGGEGEGGSPGPNETDEGFVHIGNGIHELGDEDELGNRIINPKTYDWRNSVARITVRRMQ